MMMNCKRFTGKDGVVLEALTTLPPFDEARLAHFEAYVARLRTVFHRTDQTLRFRAYLRGLLEPTERKNVESIAAAASRSMMVEADLAQALQHFVSQSPWDSGRLLAAVLAESRSRRDDAEAVWIIHDTTFAKKGQHSVGVMRQLARDVGKKINCQVAVALTQVGPRGCFPLMLRLYLPAGWLKDNAETVERSVPVEHRVFVSKGAIATQLLQFLVESGEVPRPIHAESSYLNDEGFCKDLVTHGWGSPTAISEQASGTVMQCWQGLKTILGLEHFEGRTWQGWHHHASLVFTAFDLLQAELRDEEEATKSSPWR
jgi:SRSO17 transposase